MTSTAIICAQMVLIIVWSFMLLTLLIDCRKKFPLTEIALFFKFDFLLIMRLLDALVSAYGFPYNAERDKERYASAPQQDEAYTQSDCYIFLTNCFKFTKS